MKRWIFWIVACLGFTHLSIAQVNERGPSGSYNTASAYDQNNLYHCAVPSARLLDSPGASGTTKEYIFFGDQVRFRGQTVYRNRRQYLQVITAGSETGWVLAEEFVHEGGLVAFLEDVPTYSRPGSNVISRQGFRKGDPAIVTHFQDDWVELIGPEPEKKGWINRIDALSLEPIDISIAQMLIRAQASETPQSRIFALEDIRNIPGFNNSPLADVVRQRINETPPPVITEPIPQPNPDLTTPITPGNIYVDEILTPDGRRLFKVTEIGAIQPVEGPKGNKRNGGFFAYHKHRPIGSEILLERPDGGYEKLIVVNRLRDDNSAIIGLGREVLQIVFGSNYQQVKQARVVYIQE